MSELAGFGHRIIDIYDRLQALTVEMSEATVTDLDVDMLLALEEGFAHHLVRRRAPGNPPMRSTASPRIWRRSSASP